MASLELLTYPIRDKLNACESQQEAWQRDHETAKMVFRFEDLLNDLVESFQNLDRLDKWFRDAVMENPNCYSESFDNLLRKLYARFHDVAIASNIILEIVEKDYSEVDSAREFRRCLETANAAKKADFRMEAKIDRQELQTEVNRLFAGE